MFAKIARPSSTAATIDAKLSSDSTMSAASFETSVPRDAHGHADVRFLQRRRIVHAVSRHGHDGARALQRIDDAQFVFGIHPGVDGHVRSRARERVGRQLLQLCSRRRAAVGADPELSGNDACRAWMVARDHDGTNAGVFCARDRVFRLGTRRIDDADQSGEHEILFDPFVRMGRMLRQRLARQPSAGDAERPQRLARERLVGLE